MLPDKCCLHYSIYRITWVLQQKKMSTVKYNGTSPSTCWSNLHNSHVQNLFAFLLIFTIKYISYIFKLLILPTPLYVTSHQLPFLEWQVVLYSVYSFIFLSVYTEVISNNSENTYCLLNHKGRAFLLGKHSFFHINQGIVQMVTLLTQFQLIPVINNHLCNP